MFCCFCFVYFFYMRKNTLIYLSFFFFFASKTQRKTYWYFLELCSVGTFFYFLMDFILLKIGFMGLCVYLSAFTFDLCICCSTPVSWSWPVTTTQYKVCIKRTHSCVWLVYPIKWCLWTRKVERCVANTLYVSAKERTDTFNNKGYKVILSLKI